MKSSVVALGWVNRLSRILNPPIMSHKIGALVIRIGFWGIVYYSSNQEPPG